MKIAQTDSHRPFLVGLVGTGVLPSLTPPMHMAEAKELGLSYIYRPIDMDEHGLKVADLPQIMTWTRALGYDALNITFPCKQAVVELLDTIDPVAKQLGAVNTVIFTPEGSAGYNTDTTGFERAFQAGMPDAPRHEVVLLGAGGGGSAVSDALLRLGTEHLTIIDIEPDRAQRLVTNLRARHGKRAVAATPADLPDLLQTADGLVNCTPVGMHHHPGMPLAPELVRPQLWVADIVYRPLTTQLLAHAQSLGCMTLSGSRMAVFQAVEAFELITGISPDPERMARSFLSLLGDDDPVLR